MLKLHSASKLAAYTECASTAAGASFGRWEIKPKWVMHTIMYWVFIFIITYLNCHHVMQILTKYAKSRKPTKLCKKSHNYKPRGPNNLFWHSKTLLSFPWYQYSIQTFNFQSRFSPYRLLLQLFCATKIKSYQPNCADMVTADEESARM